MTYSRDTDIAGVSPTQNSCTGINKIQRTMHAIKLKLGAFTNLVKNLEAYIHFPQTALTLMFMVCARFFLWG